jgi:hypothetical protein
LFASSWDSGKKCSDKQYQMYVEDRKPGDTGTPNSVFGAPRDPSLHGRYTFLVEKAADCEVACPIELFRYPTEEVL